MYYNKTLYSSIKIKILFNFVNYTVLSKLTSTSYFRKDCKFISQLQLHQFIDDYKAAYCLKNCVAPPPPREQVWQWARGGDNTGHTKSDPFRKGSTCTPMFCHCSDFGWLGILPQVSVSSRGVPVLDRSKTSPFPPKGVSLMRSQDQAMPVHELVTKVHKW